eukprot:COSAG01_NODE_5908_length_3959_cov_7.025389_3_plen_106_part_00
MHVSRSVASASRLAFIYSAVDRNRRVILQHAAMLNLRSHSIDKLNRRILKVNLPCHQPDKQLLMHRTATTFFTRCGRLRCAPALPGCMLLQGVVGRGAVVVAARR